MFVDPVSDFGLGNRLTPLLLFRVFRPRVETGLQLPLLRLHVQQILPHEREMIECILLPERHRVALI